MDAIILRDSSDKGPEGALPVLIEHYIGHRPTIADYQKGLSAALLV